MKLFFFQTLALTVEVVFKFTPDEDQVAPAVGVPHFDCSEMTENTLYALNQKRPSHIAPEELGVNYPRNMLHNKNFRKKLNAPSNSEYNINVKNNTVHITTIVELTIVLAGLRGLNNFSRRVSNSGREREITFLDRTISFGFDTKNLIVETIGDTDDENRIECDGKGWITRNTFLRHMQATTSKVTMESGKALSDTGLNLQSALEELGWGTASLDPYADIWGYLDCCVVQFLETKK